MIESPDHHDSIGGYLLVSVVLHLGLALFPWLSLSPIPTSPDLHVQVGLVSVTSESATTLAAAPSHQAVPDPLATPPLAAPRPEEPQPPEKLEDPHHVTIPFQPTIHVETVETVTPSPQNETTRDEIFTPASMASESRQGTPVQNAGVRVPARFISLHRPRYPSLALARRWEGVVIVKIHLADNGHPTSAEIHQTSGHPVLDQTALDFARSARFEPARQDGRGIESIELLPIRFRLTDPSAPPDPF